MGITGQPPCTPAYAPENIIKSDARQRRKRRRRKERRKGSNLGKEIYKGPPIVVMSDQGRASGVLLKQIVSMKHTVCPRRSYPFYTVCYYINYFLDNGHTAEK